MRTPTKDQIKRQEDRFYLVRQSDYNGGTSEKVSWNVCERIDASELKVIREHNTRRDALDYLFICAKV